MLKSNYQLSIFFDDKYKSFVRQLPRFLISLKLDYRTLKTFSQIFAFRHFHNVSIFIRLLKAERLPFIFLGPFRSNSSNKCRPHYQWLNMPIKTMIWCMMWWMWWSCTPRFWTIPRGEMRLINIWSLVINFIHTFLVRYNFWSLWV